ncbi:hypothetical protein [Salmonella phage SD-1_S14]|nr:hypothetical protein [Salmonella phage SD-1_S14]
MDILCCVQLIPCEYIYTGGLESGMCARIIQYPRFPKEEVYLNRDVLNYAKGLAEELCQKSFTIERNNDTIYYERNGLKKFGKDFLKCIRYTYDANPEMTAIVGVFITLVVLSFIVV